MGLGKILLNNNCPHNSFFKLISTTQLCKFDYSSTWTFDRDTTNAAQNFPASDGEQQIFHTVPRW